MILLPTKAVWGHSLGLILIEDSPIRQDATKQVNVDEDWVSQNVIVLIYSLLLAKFDPLQIGFGKKIVQHAPPS